MVRGGSAPPGAPTVHDPRGLGHLHLRQRAALVQGEPEQEDGGLFWVRLQASVTLSDSDLPVWRVTLSDITDQKQARDSLRDSEARLRVLLTNAPVVLFAVDGAGIVTFAEGRGLAGMGFAPEEVYGRPANNLFAEHPVIRAAIHRALAGEALTRIAQIAGMWFDIRLLPLPESDHRVAGVIGVAIDVTGRKRAEDALQLAHDDLDLLVQERTAELKTANEALRQSRDQLQLLGHRLVQAQEDERRAIARELHDGAGQALTCMILELSALSRDTTDRPDITARIQKLHAATEGLMSELHTLAANLHPAALSRLGLVPAVRQHIGSLQNTANLQIQVEDVGFDANRLPPDVEIAVYRVVQEAMNNAIRHAQARDIGVVMQIQPGHLLVSVEDDGVGFNAEIPAADRLGILSMHERIEMLGGSVTIESSPGAGTTVFVDVPL
jgi:PAS domain S-box-containing protein